MSFLRPEATATLMQWREVLIGLTALAFGLWLAATSFGATFLIGLGAAAFGGGLAAVGVQRARFRTANGSVGVVELDERRVTFLGPFGGGAMALDEIVTLSIHPHPAWILTDRSGERLMIPIGAQNAEGLFDAFAVLPGLSSHRLVTAVRTTPAEVTVLWRRPARAAD